ncbi:MAG: histidine--tRNA ligase [Endomicrobia bacterium]|nr:histidine--tRNA ligase [Endomicrobiia bacterium]
MFLKRVRGVRDILPSEAEKIHIVVDTCTDIAKSFGFREVILPVLEHLELYLHTLGETTDIVEKQMFCIMPRGEHNKDELYVLRPEGTAGIVRMYKENNLKTIYSMRRFFYFGPMFRYERPQKGRFREFYQFGIEIFAEPPVGSDFVIIKLASLILERLNIKYELEVNSIGCINCRKDFINSVGPKLEKLKHRLCNVCLQRLSKNPLRIFDCKTDMLWLSKEINVMDLDIQKFLCKNCNKEYEETLILLKENNIEYKTIPTLVRGLDYYNGFVFEFKTNLLQAAQNTLCAGGRYDGLVSQVDAETKYACGAAFGIDRLVELVQYLPINAVTKVGIAIVNDNYFHKAFSFIDNLLNIKNAVIIGPIKSKSLKAQLRIFNNENCKYVIIVGDEVKYNQVVVKNFEKNIQNVVNISEINKVIQ